VSSARNTAARHRGRAADGGAARKRLSGANGGRLGIGAGRLGWGNMCSGE